MRPSGAPVRQNERVMTTRSGAEIHRGAGGQVHEVHARGMVINHGPGGSRTVVRERPGHVVVVSNHYGHGYISRPYAYHGVEFYHRTYYYNGVAYGRFYRPYVWGGVALNVYVPGYYFRPAFYGWVYNPWVTPVPYAWGWGGVPWYGYYGGWFTPYPAYASASLWLTDYMISQTLQAAYAERAAELANQQAQFTEPVSPAVKQAIADEVRRQIALENAESATGVQTPPDPGSSGLARMLSDNASHVFVVSNALDVQSNAGECPMTEGDVLQLSPGTPADATAANLVVLASKGSDCRKGATVTVGVADLQEMQNHMRETLDQGMQDLQKKQGQGGLPPAPQSANAAPQQTQYAAIAPPPDPNAGQELSQQSQEADRAEQEALKESGPSDGGSSGGPSGGPSGGNSGGNSASVPPAPPAPPAAPKTVTLGMSNEEVISILGQPVQIADTGTKKMYVYKDLKVVFTNGKVSDIK